MKKVSKVVVVALALALLVGGLTACSSKSSGVDSKTGTMDGTKIVFGTHEGFQPFEFVDNTNAVLKDSQGVGFAGIDMEIANAIAKDNGLTAEISNMEFDSLLTALETGKIDAAIAGMSVTEERKKSVDFTDCYWEAINVMIVPEASTIAKATDMKDKKITVVQGYTAQSAVEALKEKEGSGYDISFYSKKAEESIAELKNGKADVFVVDSVSAVKFVEANPGLKIVNDDSAFEVEQYAIAVKKGNTTLLNLLNKGIKSLIENGKIAEFAVKYN